MNWTDIHTDTPKKTKEYLCWTMHPGRCGTAVEKYNIIVWDNLLGEWECKGLIVTHWAELPPAPRHKFDPLSKKGMEEQVLQK